MTVSDKQFRTLAATVDEISGTMAEMDTRVSHTEKAEATPVNIDQIVADKVDAAVQKIPAPAGVSEEAITAAVTKHLEAHPPVVPAPQMPTQELSPFRWFDKAKRYLFFMSFWWATSPNWKAVFDNIDIMGPIVINPRSGFGDKVEPDFTALVQKIKATGRPVIGYVRTIKATRTKEEVLDEIKKYQDGYMLDGVFLDEMVNGWSEAEATKIAWYKDLYMEIKRLYGNGFLVVGNPGSNTKPELLECADMLITFEKNIDKYLNDTDAPVTPDHYKTEPAIRFIHVAHNADEDKTAKAIEKAEDANVATLFITDDTFSGVAGSESETNNPYDQLPSAPILGRVVARARRMPYGERPADEAAITKIIDSKGLTTNAQVTSVVNSAVAEAVKNLPTAQVTAVSDPGAAYVLDSRFGEVIGGDITANLQAAINDPNVRVIRIPSGEYKIGTVTVDKLKGKVLEGAGRDTTKLVYNKAAANVPFLATSGGGISDATFKGFSLDLGWVPGDPVRHGMQLSNAPRITFRDLFIKNVGGAGIILQSLGAKAEAISTGAVFENIKMDGIGLADGTTGFGIRLVNNAGQARISGLDFSNIKGGMGIGGAFDKGYNNIGPSNITIESSFIRMAEGRTGFEPIGFTKECSEIIVKGNHLWSYDNGTSLSGSRCKFEGNIVYSAWNFGVALGDDDPAFTETLGSTVSDNTFMDIGLENEVRNQANPFGYAIVRLAKPRRCTVRGNTYIGRPGLADHFVKIVGTNGGFNDITGNAIAATDVKKAPVLGQVATDNVQEFKSA